METFNQAVYEKLNNVGEVVIRKQHDYGSGNILNAPVDPRLGVLIRLNDKLHRAANLINKGADPKNESLQDTYTDIVGYGTILLMLQDGSFELPLDNGKV
jgi:hypothetical protein